MNKEQWYIVKLKEKEAQLARALKEIEQLREWLSEKHEGSRCTKAFNVTLIDDEGKERSKGKWQELPPIGEAVSLGDRVMRFVEKVEMGAHPLYWVITLTRDSSKNQKLYQGKLSQDQIGSVPQDK